MQLQAAALAAPAGAAGGAAAVAPPNIHIMQQQLQRCAARMHGALCGSHLAPRAQPHHLQQQLQQQPCSSSASLAMPRRSSSVRRNSTGRVWPVAALQQQQAPPLVVASSSSSLQPPPLLHQQQQQLRLPVLPVVAAHQLFTAALHSLPAHAAETIPPEAITLFREFLDQIAALGPWGAVLFVATVCVAESVPLLPTQPLSLASGLLFGPVKGALLMLLGVTLAAINAYSLSRGVGKKLAQKVIAAELSGEGGQEGGAVAKQLAAVMQAIEGGGFMRQVTAITLLRLTPVVPFSASNYLLGLTPVQLGPLIVGTVAGMSVWAILYASLGGASKRLLESGADLDVLLADLGEKAGQYSSDVAVLGLGVGVLLGGGYLLTQRMQQQPLGSGSPQPELPPLPPLETPREEVLQGQQK